MSLIFFFHFLRLSQSGILLYLYISIKRDIPHLITVSLPFISSFSAPSRNRDWRQYSPEPLPLAPFIVSYIQHFPFIKHNNKMDLTPQFLFTLPFLCVPGLISFLFLVRCSMTGPGSRAMGLKEALSLFPSPKTRCWYVDRDR